MFLHVDSEDSDQTGLTAGRTGHFVGFVMQRLMLSFYSFCAFASWLLYVCGKSFNQCDICDKIFLHILLVKETKMEKSTKFTPTINNLALEKLQIRSIYMQFEPPHDKTNKMTVHLAKKTQLSLGIRPI